MPGSERYKCCIVPQCKNSTFLTPEKAFFNLPADENVRKKWCQAMKLDKKKISELSPSSVHYVCEDHFELQNDLQNYMQHKLQGGRMLIKKGVVPHIFNCQRTSARLVSKKQRCTEIEDLKACQPSSSHNSDSPMETENTSLEIVPQVHLKVKLEPGVKSVQELDDDNVAQFSKSGDEDKNTLIEMNGRPNSNNQEPSDAATNDQHVNNGPVFSLECLHDDWNQRQTTSPIQQNLQLQNPILNAQLSQHSSDISEVPRSTRFNITPSNPVPSPTNQTSPTPSKLLSGQRVNTGSSFSPLLQQSYPSQTHPPPTSYQAARLSPHPLPSYSQGGPSQLPAPVSSSHMVISPQPVNVNVTSPQWNQRLTTSSIQQNLQLQNPAVNAQLSQDSDTDSVEIIDIDDVPDLIIRPNEENYQVVSPQIEKISQQQQIVSPPIEKIPQPQQIVSPTIEKIPQPQQLFLLFPENLPKHVSSTAVEKNPVLDSPTQTVFSRNVCKGKHNFMIGVPCVQEINKKPESIAFCELQNKIYVNKDQPFKIIVKADDVPPGSLIKVAAVYCELEHACTGTVQRCPTHAHADRVKGVHLYKHVVVSLSSSAIYEEQKNMLSVFVPYEKPESGELYTVYLFKITCFSSCSGGINRRPFALKFTLENNGVTLGKQSVNVKSCACMWRDYKNEVQKLLSRDTEQNHSTDADDLPPNNSVRVRETGQTYTIRVKDVELFCYLKEMKSLYEAGALVQQIRGKIRDNSL